MEAPFKALDPQAGEAGDQMVVQQFARYPATLETPLRSGSPGSGLGRVVASTSPPLRRKDTPRSLQSSPRGPLSSVMTPSALRTGMSRSPPLFDANTRHQLPRDSIGDGERRAMPSRDVTDETIDDAYVAFILYCNPNVPASTDTSELCRTFRGPPRSDGKSFSTYTLWELIQKLDQKVIKTWIQLAIELGVERPSLEKKQSTQKVQQYAVRLKRWMRAMHVDAFFEYLLNHPHSYYSKLPLSNGPASESRDGVPFEEDLALRALVPEWKPKRGRKRAEDKENEDSRFLKRPQIDTSLFLDSNALAAHAANFPQSAIPFSAFPDDMEVTDPWVDATSSFRTDGLHADSLAGQDLRWRPLDRNVSPPGYPRSAIIPRNHKVGDTTAPTEPRSAVTPSSRERTGNRRRHGPAVSSAWPSTSGSLTGKVRGRPPNRGSAPGGPFSSFPVNPARSTTPGDNASRRSSPAVVADHSQLLPPRNHTPNSARQSITRPGKLQLHVPQNTGGPIRLATPPTLMLNGVGDVSSRHASFIGRRDSIATNDLDDTVSLPSMITDPGILGVPGKASIDDVIRVVAGRLLRAKMIGRSIPIEPDEARTLAHVAVRKLQTIYSGIPLESVTVLCALYFGVGHKVGLGNVPPGSLTVKVVNGSSENGSLVGASVVGQTYTILVDSRPGHGLGFNSALSDLSLSIPHVDNRLKESTETLDFPTEDDDFDNELVADSSNDEGSWRQRYLRLRHQMRRKEAALREYKKNILQSVMADV